jgi:hypothetical protein
MFLWVAFVALPWWAMTLWLAYTLYFIIRACMIWKATTEDGVIKGYKYVFFGYKPKHIRLYHLLRMLFDIPPAIIGLFFPLIKAICRMKIYTFEEGKKAESNETKTP